MAAQPVVKSNVAPSECNELPSLGTAKWWATQIWLLAFWVKPRVREIAVHALWVKGNSTTQPFTGLSTGREGGHPLHHFVWKGRGKLLDSLHQRAPLEMGIRDREGWNEPVVHEHIPMCSIYHISYISFAATAISYSEWLYCNSPCPSTLVDITSCFLFERKYMKKKQNHLHCYCNPC